VGRHATGWTIRLPKGRHVYSVYFTHAGRTVERSTGQRERGEASRVAAEIYGRVVTGQAAPRPVAEDLVTLMGTWLTSYQDEHTPETSKIVEGYARSLLAFFGSLDRFTPSGYAEYVRHRLGAVSRSTVRKEVSALRRFASWAETERDIRLPPVPGVPKKGGAGTRSHRARRRVATVLTPAEVARILDAMPVKSPRSGTWLRPFFAVVWETGLRPYSTIAKLRSPEHYRKGSDVLFIGSDVDKTKFQRELPLSKAALAALDVVCPAEGGLLFPAVDKDAMRVSLTAAVEKAGIVRPVSIYDLRHSRLSQLANSGAPLAGVSFLAGHKYLSTTSLYVQSSAAAARAALDTVSWDGASKESGEISGNQEKNDTTR
jgi:integrase